MASTREGIDRNAAAAKMGIINATGLHIRVWGSTFPFNPYPFPWANHLFQDRRRMAHGCVRGHMAKMAEGFKAIRMAELELLADGYEDHGEARRALSSSFGWQQFTDEEWETVPARRRRRR